MPETPVQYRRSRTRGAVDVFVPFEDHRFGDVLTDRQTHLALPPKDPAANVGVWMTVPAVPSAFNRLKLDWQAAQAVVTPPTIR
jgi:hypothetical protein